MSNAFAASADTRVNRSYPIAFTRVTLAAIGVFSFLLAPLRATDAQVTERHNTTAPDQSWELRFTSGALVGTGAQRNVLQDAQLSAAQVSWRVHPLLAVSGTLTWARSRDLNIGGRPKLDVFTSDLGVELRPATWLADRAVTFSPFVGAGAGARSYNYRSLDVDATNNLAGYVAVGGEVGMGRFGVRIEARDYATGFKPLVGVGTSEMRNDVVIAVGVRFKKVRSSQR